MSLSINITLECHGALTERMDGPTAAFVLEPPHTVKDLLEQTAAHWPSAADLLSRTACARGDTLLSLDEALVEGDQIALIPPVSGGMPSTRTDTHLTADPLDLNILLEETEDKSCGALVVFGGTVRLNNAGRQVKTMDYSAYGPLAARTMAEIERETLDAFDIVACRLQHRTGQLALGEISVYVVVRAVHRGPAFEAARHALEELKARVAVWKNEYYTDGSSAYLEGTEVPKPERPR